MLRSLGRTVLDKVVKAVSGKVTKYIFWTTVALVGPLEIVSMVGVPVALVTTAVVHSGLIEAGASKVVEGVVLKSISQ